MMRFGAIKTGLLLAMALLSIPALAESSRATKPAAPVAREYVMELGGRLYALEKASNQILKREKPAQACALMGFLLEKERRVTEILRAPVMKGMLARPEFAGVTEAKIKDALTSKTTKALSFCGLGKGEAAIPEGDIAALKKTYAEYHDAANQISNDLYAALQRSTDREIAATRVSKKTR